MSTQLPRFEIVRADRPADEQPWFSRVYKNGKVFTSENYSRRGPARRAVAIVAEMFGWTYVPEKHIVTDGYRDIEVRDVDERVTS